MNLQRTLILPKVATDKDLVHKAFKFYLHNLKSLHLFVVIGDGDTARKLAEKADLRIRTVEQAILTNSGGTTTKKVKNIFWVIWARSLANVQELLEDNNLIQDDQQLVSDWKKILSLTIEKKVGNSTRKISSIIEYPVLAATTTRSAGNPSVAAVPKRRIFNPHITRKLNVFISEKTVS